MAKAEAVKIPRADDGRSTQLRSDLLRQLANTSGQLACLQRENDSVRRRMDDILRCNARLATMLHQQGRMLSEMSAQLEELQASRGGWLGRWLASWREAA